MCTGEGSVAGRTVDPGERCGAIGAESRAWEGAGDWQYPVPEMGRRNGCRGWGCMVGKGERSCDESRGCGAGHGETHGGVW